MPPAPPPPPGLGRCSVEAGCPLGRQRKQSLLTGARPRLLITSPCAADVPQLTSPGCARPAGEPRPGAPVTWLPLQTRAPPAHALAPWLAARSPRAPGRPEEGGHPGDRGICASLPSCHPQALCGSGGSLDQEFLPCVSIPPPEQVRTPLAALSSVIPAI